MTRAILKFRAGLTTLGILCLGAQPPSAVQAPMPLRPAHPSHAAPPKALSEADAGQVASLDQRIEKLRQAGRFTEAVEPARRILTLCEKSLGFDHWQTSDARCMIAKLERLSRFPEEGRKAFVEELDLQNQYDASQRDARFSDSERLSRERLRIWERWFGPNHPDVANVRNNLGLNLNQQGRYAEADPVLSEALKVRLAAGLENHPETAPIYTNLGISRNGQRRFTEAETDFNKALEIQRAARGERHAAVVLALDNLGSCLDSQGRHTEAEPHFREALRILRDMGRGDQSEAANALNNLGLSLNGQGRFAEAESHFREVRAIWLATRGEVHPDTITVGNNLGSALNGQGRYAEGEQYLRSVLAVLIMIGREKSIEAAYALNNLAFNLNRQGKHVEAEREFREALGILRLLPGEHRREIAAITMNLGVNLDVQEKHVDAERLLRDAIAALVALWKNDHPDIAAARNNLGTHLYDRGRYAEAEREFHEALGILRESLGQARLHAAIANKNIGVCLDVRGRYVEAEPFYNNALKILVDENLLDHPDATSVHVNMGDNLDARGKLGEAVRIWKDGVSGFDRSRMNASPIGIERALIRNPSPRSFLAAALARQGRFHEAWRYWEDSLAIGLLDDVSARRLRPMSSEQRKDETELRGQLQSIVEQISRLDAKPARSPDEERRLDQLRRRSSELRGRFVGMQVALNAQFHEFAGVPATLDAIRDALPAHAALVGWLDLNPHGPPDRDRSPYHWACVIRRDGDPLWIPIPGIGPDRAWSETDEQRPGALRAALRGKKENWRAFATDLARQRLEPIRDYLKGITHLVILPSSALAGIPVEVLMDAQTKGAPRPTISYAPSGTMYARLKGPRPGQAVTPRLLAVGDPAFSPRPLDAPSSLAPPERGVAVLASIPGKPAQQARLESGDVLLKYDGKALRAVDDLVPVPTTAGTRRIPIEFWREGEIRAGEIAPGNLGIHVDRRRSVAEVVSDIRRAKQLSRPSSGSEAFDRLPSSRVLVKAIATLQPEIRATLLLGRPDRKSAAGGSEYLPATEATLQRMASAGELKQFKYIIIYTHCISDPLVAMNSALFLPPEEEPGAADVLVGDGRITAEQIVMTWDLDAAELVVLAACESGLGRYAGGEGYLGFAQALFVKGARSVVLSQWRVDDRPTALLMHRFFGNILGKRPGRGAPTPKAEALAEAKSWLKGLDARQAEEAWRKIEADASARGRGAEADDDAPTPPGEPFRPYEHPYYWAGFVLLGDPD